MKAKQRARPVNVFDVGDIASAVNCLKVARELLRRAQAGNAANYVARALKSAQGALNNAQRMRAKQERAERAALS